MKGKIPYIIAIIAFVLVVLYVFIDRNSQNGNSSKSPANTTIKTLGELTPDMSLDEMAQKVYTQKLKVYGIVLDQNNQPVPDVFVKCSYFGLNDIADSWTGGRPNYIFDQSDAEGRFDFEGTGGAFTVFFVSHPECIKTSQSTLKLSALNQSHEIDGINYDNPGVMRVFRTGKKMPLYGYRATSLWLKVDSGKTYFLGFKNGKLSEQATPHSLPIRLIGGLYGSSLEYLDGKSYKYGIEIGGHGNDVQIAPAKEEDYQIAPLEGYQNSQILGELTDSENKMNFISSSYFVKFGDGTHGYVELRTRNLKVHFALYYNPKPDSRNLNFDPEIAIVNK